MKNIKEKQLLVKWARAMGESIDPMLLEEVERHEQLEKNIIESVRENLLNDLTAASKAVPKAIETRLSNNEFPKPPSLDDLQKLIEETKDELVQTETAAQKIPIEKTIPNPPNTDLICRTVEHITKEVKLEENSFQQPNPSLVDKNLEAIQKKLKFLEQAIGKVAAHGPGSGSYWLYDLGDTNYNIVKNPSDKDVLTFNSANTKWEVGNVNNVLGTRYHGSYFSNVTQYVTNTSQSFYITTNNVDIQKGFTTDGANLIAQYSGVYNLQFSCQLHFDGGGGNGKLVELWLEKNGVSVPSTNTRVDITSNNPYSVMAWNFLISLDAGDKTALRWASENTHIGLDSNSGRVGPSVPSVILTIVQV